MDATRWLQLKDLFRQAFDLPPAERSAFLTQHCGDPELRARVEALLHTDERASDTTTAPLPFSNASPGVAQAASATASLGLAEQPGTKIGPYKLLQRIGEGGFGTVFMAEQEQPLRRRVAFKIIKPGMDTREVVARFEQERQALALMDHPHIARVLDGGATETGRPYFVMELVRGVPVTEYCDTHNLSIRDRLDLFIKICQAVQHAHQKGVIHRDLKPSNILVASLDGRAHPKVIDFGIAKALRERLTDKTLFTNFQQIVGTPQYMSPEQVEASLDIDTRSDVYSLGVLLYELLTGTTPFDIRRLRSLAEVQRMIREVEPPKPSTRLGALRTKGGAAADDSAAAGLPGAPPANAGSSLLEIARQRRTDASNLVRQLRGEPDWIVMRALEKDRARRYESVGALAADAQRHLNNEPVLAGPPSRWYRLRKIIRRNRTGVIAAALIVLSLLAGLAAALAGLWQAQAALKREAKEAKKAREVQHVLERAMTTANPYDTIEPNLTVRELLDRTAATLGESLAEQPEVEAAVRMTVGFAYRALGAFETAEKQFRRSAELRAALADGEAARAEALVALGDALRLAGRPAEAEGPLREGVERYERAAPGSPELAGALFSLAEWKLDTGDSAGAETDIRRSGDLIGKFPVPDDLGQATKLMTLGRLYERQGNLERAENALRHALELFRPLAMRDVGVEIKIVVSLSRLGAVLLTRGDHAGALASLEESHEILRRHVGEEHPDVAIVLNNLASLYRNLGRLDEAEALVHDALDMNRRLRPPGSRAILDNLSTLAAIQYSTGRYSAAVENFEQVVAELRRGGGPNNPQLAMELANLANAVNGAGDPGRAEELMRQALQAAQASLGENHFTTIRLVGDWATFLVERRKFEAAEPLVRRSLAGNRRLYGETHKLVARDLNTLAMILDERGQTDEAVLTYRECLTVGRAALGARHPDLTITMCNLGTLLNYSGRAAEAEPLAREALAVCEAALPPDHPQTVRARQVLGLALTRSDRAAEGEPLLRQVYGWRVAALPPRNPVLAHTRGALGECLTELGRFEEAEPLLLAAEELFRTERGVNHSDTREQARRLARLYAAWGRDEAAALWQARAAAPSTAPASNP